MAISRILYRIEDELLDNEFHPVFDKSNWITPFGYDAFDNYYTLISPALRLASKFLEDPHMLKLWIHLRYGSAGFVNGWVGVEDSPE
jgi:hypothetical protein